MLKHAKQAELEEHLPFEVLEAGFEDNIFGKTYQTVYFNVSTQNQQALIDEVTMNLKKGKSSSFSATDLVAKAGVTIDQDFLFPKANLEVTETQHQKQTELLIAVLNGFKIHPHQEGSKHLS